MTSYAPGSSTGRATYLRTLPPLIATLITEIGFPAISLAIDFPLRDTLLSSKPGVDATVDLIDFLTIKYGTEFSEIVASLFLNPNPSFEDFTDVFWDFMRLLLDIVTDPEFLTVASRKNGLGVVFFEGFQKFTDVFLKKINPIENVIVIANFALAGGKFAEIMLFEDDTDTYAVTFPANNPPIITSCKAEPSTIFGGNTTTLSAVATDPDGDPITFGWTQGNPAAPSGSFTTPTATSINWVAPIVGVDTNFTLQVTATDGDMQSNPCQVMVTVKFIPPVEKVSLIGVVPDVFTTNGGTFKVSVSPKDAAGNLITGGVTTANFAFQDITVSLPTSPGTPVTRGSADVTEVEIIAATPGEPVTLVLDLDSSGSMSFNDPSRLRVEAGKQLVSLLEPTDQAAIMDFGASITAGFRASRILQGFTSDLTLLEAGINRVTAFGGTPLFDSTLDALDLLSTVSARHPVVVVLTDGEDTTSLRTPADVIGQAKARTTPIFTIGLGSGVGFASLQNIARETGGTFAEAIDAEALSLVFEDIGFGIVEGRIVVDGEGRFEPPLTSPGEYVVSGVLVTTLGGTSVTTPFSFTVDVVKASGTTSAVLRSLRDAAPYLPPYSAEQEIQWATEFLALSETAE